jgi:hypothetical protein
MCDGTACASGAITLASSGWIIDDGQIRPPPCEMNCPQYSVRKKSCLPQTFSLASQANCRFSMAGVIVTRLRKSLTPPSGGGQPDPIFFRPRYHALSGGCLNPGDRFDSKREQMPGTQRRSNGPAAASGRPSPMSCSPEAPEHVLKSLLAHPNRG